MAVEVEAEVEASRDRECTILGFAMASISQTIMNTSVSKPAGLSSISCGRFPVDTPASHTTVQGMTMQQLLLKVRTIVNELAKGARS